MLSLNEIVNKISAAPEQFEQMMHSGRYSDAKWLFYACIATADFIELDNAAMERLFGDNGAFNPELVKEAYEKAGGGIDRPAENHAENARHGRSVRPSFYTQRALERLKAASESTKCCSVHGTS